MNEELLTRIRQIWDVARVQVVRSVNSAHVCANWLIGQQIVEAEQGGEVRAGHGKALLKSLSQQLKAEYGSGFSVSGLQYMRSFYLKYPMLLSESQMRDVDNEEISTSPMPKQHALRVVSTTGSSDEWKPGVLNPNLSWTHYRTLLKVEHQTARNFYEIEAVKNGWSTRQLARQINSLLFEFLDLPESHRLAESQLEEALLTHLQDFLLELGNGFAFVGRQVRLTLEGDHFYPDLIFYHIKLKCYVVIDLKVDKLSHADLGQMQLYVHYYDREIADPHDNPTIGLILCTDKNDALVQYVLDEKNQQIFASRYQLHLPSEEELQALLKRELELLEQID